MAKTKDNYEAGKIQVIFNKKDPEQLKLFQHAASRTNRSGFIKRLIQRDMDGASFISYQAAPTKQPTVPEDFQVDGFI